MDILHKKLVLSESVFGPGAYGDSYAATGSCNESARPLVVYIGGSIDDKTYEARGQAEPVAVAKEFLAAAGSEQAVDLLVCPFPPPSRTPAGDGSEPADGPDGVAILSKKAWQSILRERFGVHLISELLRARGTPLPSSIALVGFSSGAYLAVGLALDLPKAKGAAVFGGTGMAEALAQSDGDAHRSKQFLTVVGDDDPLEPRAREFSSLLGRFGGKSKVLTVRSGHSYQEYAACGAVQESFNFALRLLLE